MGSSSPILTTRQMRAVEEAAISSGVETGSSLMEQAGRAAALAIAAHWPDFVAAGREALILCGPGNNGGDGYVIARHLAGFGWPVRVAALAAPSTIEAEGAAALWRGETSGIGGISMAPGRSIGLCIDALFGTGITRPLGPEIAGLLRGIAASGCPIAAVDILSGICATSGRVLGDLRLPEAELTVTFHRPKLGHVLSDGGALSGLVQVCDIGLEPWSEAAGDSVVLAGPSEQLLKRGGHKYGYGHAMVLAGGTGKGGAARLAARAALRVGAGLVTLAPPPEALPENAARLDAIMLDALPDAEALLQRLRDPRINALCLGPGLGLARARALVVAALESGRAMVLDADALTAFSDGPDGLFSQLHEGVVLTPHDGEFARLFPDLARKLRDEATRGPAISRLDAVRLAAARSGATVLLKGPDTVISSPEGRGVVAAATGANAAPWLATAGSGDVLAGLITGLLARGFAPLDAASQAAWLHAESARCFGPGLIAEDLPETLPQVLRAIAGQGAHFPPRIPPEPLL
ncbi:NAD(P)H-hydrate dehydratase [Paracoccus litorisediminis]|uniref:Bifunctional NAD(P)H-hydrate repair enzyme n=1 Tax=Paracoccus litorisediminis TaxID=2006130 RepID=A0A844HIF4_9RHOB|nr:NAD(P)H-hydrate dehydratase [Paracoccus litorisediminis]MTH59636.1 NAD(P)H-hydrate dehydratase [Paracoccus litorisediminis]